MKIERRVIGGSNTGVNEYPWMALLIIGSDFPRSRCGGSLISSKWVLSATHCVDQYSTDYYIGNISSKEEDNYVTFIYVVQKT